MRERIGPYRIESVIDKGGMGLVYKGRHDTLGRCAAIKTLLPNALDAVSRERLLREARTQALIASHPNVVAVYELILEDGALFIAMEYVDGETLAVRLRNADGGLGVDDALHLIVQVLAALEHIHGQKIIHRDVKPSNVLIRNGVVKLTDFGIALIPDAPRLTATQRRIGTLEYMSPEQLEGGDLDPRTDVYSAGIVLYRMLAGQLPFPSRDILQAISERMAGPPEILTGLPGGVREALGIALQFEPVHRFQSAAAFAGALKDVAAGFLHPAVDPQEEIPTEVLQVAPATAEPIAPPTPRWPALPWMMIIVGSLAASGYVMVRHTPRLPAVASTQAGVPIRPPVVVPSTVTSTTPPAPPSQPPGPTTGTSPIPNDADRAPRDAEEKRRREAEENQRRAVERLRHEIQSANDRAEDALHAEQFERAVAELDSAVQKALTFPDDFWQERAAITRLHAAIVDARVAAATRVQQEALWEKRLDDVEEDLQRERWPEAERFAKQIAEDPQAPPGVAERARDLLRKAKEGRIAAFEQTRLGPTRNTIRKPSTPPRKKKN